MKKLEKVLLVILLTAFVGGIVAVETVSIAKIDKNYQTERSQKIFDDIKSDLYAVRSAIINADAEKYERNVEDLHALLSEMGNLHYVAETKAEEIARTQEYVDFLGGKEDFLRDISLIKGYNAEIQKQLEASYTDANAVTQETMVSLRDKLVEIRNNYPASSNEKAVGLAEKVKNGLSVAENAANNLADCVNKCYANKINTLVEEFSGALKNISSEIVTMNETILDDIFNVVELDKITELTF